ncbi:Aerotolerance protein BatD [hydrothermal vent metagenome]|uniref:Aerotolerance protein BatD n=1 Tax=hydrothermal vent metagenome TaxID=652676 RepID=A0A3B0V7K5_9ZZZZ
MIGKNMQKLLLIFLLLALNNITYAAVTATVDRTHIVIGETFNLTITVDDNTSAQPDLSELQQVFRVLGTSQSSSTNIINGKYSVEKSWQISLMPLAVGNNTIPPIKLGNQTTRPIQITIAKSDPNTKANGDIFIEITADKNSAFVKEQIIVTVKLFYSISLSEGNLSEPIAKNAIVTQLDKGSTYRTQRDGKTYEVIERHYAIFAEKSGKLELNPIIFNGRDNTSRRNFSMFSTGKPIRAVSKPLAFDIKPIPQQSIGKDWLPATKVQISQKWSKPPYTVGEPITRTIILYIEGLSETQIPDIDLGEIKDIRIYPEQPQTQTEATAQTLKTWKQVKLALIPTQAGAIRIPEYQLQWYNTKTNQIEHTKLPPMTLPVDAGDFAMDIPKIDNPFKQPETTNSATIADMNQPTPTTEVQIVEKTNVLWKVSTGIFALLWLITMIFYLKKPNKKAKTTTSKPVKISKRQIVAAIDNQDLSQLQKNLIKWWNQQYPNKQATNLAAIKTWLNPQMQQLINDVELQLYNPDKKHRFNQQQWLKQIKGKGLEIVQQKKTLDTKRLPELYQ